MPAWRRREAKIVKAAGIVGAILFIAGIILMVLGATRVVEFAALHHVAMLVGGISITTVGGLILWIKRFGID